MKVTITSDEKVLREYDIPTDKIIRGITKLGVFSFVGREVMRVRPPKRNIGVIFNWLTAAAVTDCIMEIGDGLLRKGKEPEVVAECENYSEVVKDKESANADTNEKTESSGDI